MTDDRPHLNTRLPLACPAHASARRLPGPRRHQLLPPAQRHDAGAAAGDVPDAQDELRARLRADRADHAHLPAHRVAAAAGGRASTPTTIRKPYSLAGRDGRSRSSGLLLLVGAPHLSGLLLVGRRWSGLGSAVFHPESSRVARMASGGRHGLAQSLFQVGGNTGSASGRCWPRSSCCRAASAASPGSRSRRCSRIVVLWRVGRWYQRAPGDRRGRTAPPAARIRRCCRRRGAMRARRADRADLLEVHLSGEHQQLLHVLPDRPVRRRACRARSSTCSSSSPRSPRAPSSAARSATGSAASW